MHALKIRKFPDSVLRKKAAKVEGIGKVERDILEGMAQAMYMSQGVGLAAVQVGIDKQMAVVDIGDGLLKLVNPVIVKREGAEAQEEGCLSVPDICVKIKRAKVVIVNFLNEEGQAVSLKAAGLRARAIQHELDHLNGKLIVDYLNPIRKLLVKRRRKTLTKD